MCINTKVMENGKQFNVEMFLGGNNWNYWQIRKGKKSYEKTLKELQVDSNAQ